MIQASQLFEQATRNCQQGDWDQALSGLEQALSNDPLHGAACRRLADTYAIRGRLKDTVTAYLRLTEILKKSGDLDSALQISDLILQLQPDSVEARLHRVAIFEHRRDDAQALRSYRELARLYVELGRGEEAISLLKEAQKSLPDELDIALELAETSVAQGHMREGLLHFSRVAHAHLDGGRPEKACQAFRRMKVVAPDDVYVLLALGRLYVELGRPVEAEQEFRAILRQDLSHHEALLCLGEVCQGKGQSRDAMLAFNRLLSLNPQHTIARERLGQLCQVQGMPVDAINHYTEAAQIYMELGEKEQAVRLHRIVLGLDPGHPTAIRELINLNAPLVPLLAELPSPPQPQQPDVQPEPPTQPRDSGRLKEHLVKRPELKPLLPGAGQARQPALKPTLSKPILRRSTAEPVAAQPPVLLAEVSEEAVFLQSLVEPAPDLDWLECEEQFSLDDLQSLAPLSGSCSWLEEIAVEPEETRPEVSWREGTWNSHALPLPIQANIVGRPQACLDLKQQCSPVELEGVQRLQLECAELDLAGQIQLCRQAIDENPESLLVRVHLAQLQLDAGLTQEAVDLYRQTLSRHPGVAGLHHQYVQALIWNGDYAQAGAACLELAELHRQLDQPQDAVDVLQLLLSLQPTHCQARQRLVDLLTELGETQLGRHHLRQLAEQATSAADWPTAAQAWQRLEDEESSPITQERLGYVAEKQGQNPIAWAHYAQLLGTLEKQQRWHEAASLCERMLVLQPHRQELLGLQVDFLKIILSTLPDHTASLRKMVELSLRSQAFEEAAEWLARLSPLYLEPENLAVLIQLHQRLLARRPDQAALYRLGELYYQSQQLDPAIECFQKTRRQPELALKSYNMLGLCFAAKEGGIMQELGIKQLRKGLEFPAPTAADQLELRYNLGVLLYRGRRLPEAAHEFRQAASLRPGYRDVSDWVDKVEQEIAS